MLDPSLFQKPTLRLTPSWMGTKDKQVLVKNSQGLILFRCALWVAGKELDHETAVSGQARNQTLMTCRNRVAGCAAPIGEGIYRLGDDDAIRRINWASGRANDFSGSWGEGLGPVWIGIHAIAGYPCDTADYGLHADWNEEPSPGTLGCTGFQGKTGPRDLARLKRVTSWFLTHDISRYVVDHGLGTVPAPPK